MADKIKTWPITYTSTIQPPTSMATIPAKFQDDRMKTIDSLFTRPNF